MEAKGAAVNPKRIICYLFGHKPAVDIGRISVCERCGMSLSDALRDLVLSLRDSERFDAAMEKPGLPNERMERHAKTFRISRW